MSVNQFFKKQNLPEGSPCRNRGSVSPEYAVYGLFGKRGLEISEMPMVNKSIGNIIRFHHRTGKHDLTLFDWEQYLKFAKEYWEK